MVESTHTLWDEFLRNRTPELKRRLVMQYLDLVRYVVNKFGLHQRGKPQGLEFQDLVHFGILGLLTAVDRFTPERNVKFETYAVPRIRGAILDEIRKLDWVPRSVREASRKAGKAAHEVSQQYGREPLDSEIAEKLEISVDEYRRMFGRGSGMYAHDTSVLTQYEGADALEVAPADGPSPIEHLSNEETRAILIEAVERLPERDRTVIALYYYEGLKFTEIARVLDVSEGRVSQIHAEVLRQLRATLMAREA